MPDIDKLINESELKCKKELDKVDELCYENSKKVLDAFHNHKYILIKLRVMDMEI